MKTRQEQANDIINNHILWAMGAGSVPFPVLDIAAVTFVQLDMIKQLSTLYNINYQESSGKNFISAIAGSTLAKIGASFVKTIPVIGTMLGGLSMAALSGASTYGMGNVFVRHLETGGNFINFDFNWGKQEYEKEYEKGKEYTTNLEKKEAKPANDRGEIFKKIDELVKLKKDGILNEAEFEKKKAELLAKLYA